MENKIISENDENNSKKITLVFDLNDDVDRKIWMDVEHYINDFNTKILSFEKDKKRGIHKMGRAQAIKKYMETKGDFNVKEDVITALSDEQFCKYAHLAYCKNIDKEVGQYEFFRNIMPKYKQSELRKLVASIID